MDRAFGFVFGIVVTLILFIFGFPNRFEIIAETSISTNKHSFVLNDIKYNIRIDTAATDSIRNKWKN